jgi:glycerate kinase
MKIVISPDSFKGSNSSIRVATLIEQGVRKVYPEAEIVKIPIADGGEGTVEAAVLGGNGQYRELEVTGPLGEKLTARYGILPGQGTGASKSAVIEMAAASGLPLVPEKKRNPLFTTTYGTGELILAALEEGCREILIGIGGSATNDAGVGMAQALGWSFKDKAGKEVGYGGKELSNIAVIDNSKVDSRLEQCKVTVACDVTNPLFGKTGAAHVYGPQKGATPEIVEELDQNLRLFAKIVESQLGKDISREPGSGAAGGLGAGLMIFCGAELKSGIDAMLDIVRFEDQLESTDLVITGEGAIDGQTTYGKVPVGIAKRTRAYNVPVLAIVGDIGAGAEAVYDHGIYGIMSTVNRAMPLKEAMAQSAPLLEDAAERVMRIIRIGQILG